MERLTSDTPKGNLQALLNFAYAKDGSVWLRGADDGKDVELCAYIAKYSIEHEICGVGHPGDVIEACGAGDCFCELGALYAAATQAAELRARLKAYEDTGLKPEEIYKLCEMEKRSRMAQMLRWEQAEAEGRLIELPCGADITIERDGFCFKGDHWNPPYLTAFADDPTTRSGERVALFSLEEVKAALEYGRARLVPTREEGGEGDGGP